MESYIKKIVWGCLLVIPFLALHVANGGAFDPISWFTGSSLFFPFISGKNLLFRVLVEVALAGWAILALSDSKYRINVRKSPIMIAYMLFIVVLFVANLFGVDVERSMWSNFERMEGFVGHIHLFAYFFVLTVMIKSEEEWRRMWKYFVLGNIVVLIPAFFQFLGAKGLIFSKIAPQMSLWFGERFPIHQSEVRLDSTIGNSAYFGVFCLMYVFIVAMMWAQSKKTNPNTKSFGYVALIVANLLGVFYSGTRGSIIGLIIGGLVTLGILALVEKGKMRKYFAVVLASVALIVSLIFVFKEVPIIKNSPTLYRLASISVNDITTASRFSIWTISYEAWKERPLLGYGQDNFSYIFARKFEPQKMCNLEPWYDRSHNVFFDWLVAGGILGLITYLSLYAVTLWYMWRKENSMSRLEKAIITGALAGYFIHNIFVFDNLTSYILFFALLAYVTVRTKDGVTHGKALVSQDSITYLVAPLIGIALLVTLYYVNYRPLVVNTLVIKAMSIGQYMQTMPFADALKVQEDAFKNAIAMNTLGSLEAREQYFQMVPRIAQVQLPDSMPQGDKQAAAQAINSVILNARQEIITTYPTYQNDVRMLSLFGIFFNGIGDGQLAEQTLAQAHLLAPRKQLLTQDFIKAKLINQKYGEAYELAKEMYNLGVDCRDVEKWLLLSAAYAGDYKNAQAYVESKGKKIALDQDIIAALITTKQKTLAIELLNEIKKQDPTTSSQVDTLIKQVLAQ